MFQGILSGLVFFITVHFPTEVVSSADEESHWANCFCKASRQLDNITRLL